jgi:hypothetical protein
MMTRRIPKNAENANMSEFIESSVRSVGDWASVFEYNGKK